MSGDRHWTHIDPNRTLLWSSWTLVIEVLAVFCAVVSASICYQAPVVRADTDVKMQLSIIPLNCYVERVNDGLRETVRIVPQACQKVTGI